MAARSWSIQRVRVSKSTVQWALVAAAVAVAVAALVLYMKRCGKWGRRREGLAGAPVPPSCGPEMGRFTNYRDRSVSTTKDGSTKTLTNVCCDPEKQQCVWASDCRKRFGSTYAYRGTTDENMGLCCSYATADPINCKHADGSAAEKRELTDEQKSRVALGSIFSPGSKGCGAPGRSPSNAVTYRSKTAFDFVGVGDNAGKCCTVFGNDCRDKFDPGCPANKYWGDFSRADSINKCCDGDRRSNCTTPTDSRQLYKGMEDMLPTDVLLRGSDLRDRQDKEEAAAAALRHKSASADAYNKKQKEMREAAAAALRHKSASADAYNKKQKEMRDAARCAGRGPYIEYQASDKYGDLCCVKDGKDQGYCVFQDCRRNAGSSAVGTSKDNAGMCCRSSSSNLSQCSLINGNAGGLVAVSIWKDSGFNGDWTVLPVGDHPYIWNDVISSIKVPYGLKVRLYEHVNYGGATEDYTFGQYASVRNGDNDEYSSARVRYAHQSF